jgi:hypothetical protein
MFIFLYKHLKLRFLDHLGQLIEASGARLNLVSRVDAIELEFTHVGTFIIGSDPMIVFQILLSRVDGCTSLQRWPELVHFRV